jgi:hypothetical protein
MNGSDSSVAHPEYISVIPSIQYLLTDCTFLVFEQPDLSPNLFMLQLTSASITVDT